MIQKWRKKPVVIEAILFDGSITSMNEIVGWVGDNKGSALMSPSEKSIFIGTLEGTHRADPGDYVIKGVKGEFYPCKPDIFAQTYEPAKKLWPPPWIDE